MRFYINNIQSTLSEVLSPVVKEKDSYRSARLGFRFGNHLAEHGRLAPEFVEKQIVNLFDTLFVAGSLKNSSAVLDSVDGKKKEIQLYKGVPGKKVVVKLLMK